MANDSSPVLPDRKTMEYIERRLKEFKMQLGPMKRGPKRWPRKGGGGSGVVETRYALVTDTAGAASWTETASPTIEVCGRSVGTCVLLSHGTGPCLGMPLLNDEGETLDDHKLRLENLYDEVPLTAGRLINISSADGLPIEAGPYSKVLEERQWVIGEYVRVTDYLRELEGFAEEKILWTPDGDAIEWAGGECPQ